MIFAHGVDGMFQKAGDRHAGNFDRILHDQENTFAGTVFGRHRQKVAAAEFDRAGSNLISGFAAQKIGQRRLAGAVRPHNRVDFALVDRQVEAFDDFPAGHAGMQILNFQ